MTNRALRSRRDAARRSGENHDSVKSESVGAWHYRIDKGPLHGHQSRDSKASTRVVVTFFPSTPHDRSSKVSRQILPRKRYDFIIGPRALKITWAVIRLFSHRVHPVKGIPCYRHHDTRGKVLARVLRKRLKEVLPPQKVPMHSDPYLARETLLKLSSEKLGSAVAFAEYVYFRLVAEGQESAAQALIDIIPRSDGLA